MKKPIWNYCFLATLILAPEAFCDGWSESALGGGAVLTIETVTTKNDGSVFVKFNGYNEIYWFQNKPYLLTEVLAAKANASKVRAWTTTGYYSVSDFPVSSSPHPTSAHYLGALQIQ